MIFSRLEYKIGGRQFCQGLAAGVFHDCSEACEDVRFHDRTGEFSVTVCYGGNDMLVVRRAAHHACMVIAAEVAEHKRRLDHMRYGSRQGPTSCRFDNQVVNFMIQL